MSDQMTELGKREIEGKNWGRWLWEGKMVKLRCYVMTYDYEGKVKLN